MDALQWMGAVRMRVQTSDSQLSTSNPHHSSPAINILWSEKLCVCKKQTDSELTLILTAPIHCSGFIGEQVMECYSLQIYSDEEINSSTSRMAWEWVHFQQIDIFGQTFPLNPIHDKCSSNV